MPPAEFLRLFEVRYPASFGVQEGYPSLQLGACGSTHLVSKERFIIWPGRCVQLMVKFAQIYFYEPDYQIGRRMGLMALLNHEVLSTLQAVLHDENDFENQLKQAY
ncbi:TPA: hypothetical protein N0F65_009977 [Lagenidium giganteum]|uniref:Uncharacterized protein n=1 Tax=Lagenidium giganteum TaxID=4803 RepID=A0AAV2YVR4_9STRA|nr:TPA: hypothetical protein N0F65_009977 [Lagenidium giganteum]